ncbi:MAG: hypothetical protein MI923_22830 [Phycisphaerales bacterium]|nr:hypothetical protein [Phycisphaerales bacterium]
MVRVGSRLRGSVLSVFKRGLNTPQRPDPVSTASTLRLVNAKTEETP